MKKLNILLTLLLLISCKISKEIKTDAFFEKWEKDSRKIFENRDTTKLENALNKIATNELCEKFSVYSKDFPKLKYFVTQEKVKVSMSDNLMADINLHTGKINNFSMLMEKYKFEDSIFENRINCKDIHLKPLILTNEYKKKVLGKLKYGFGSFSYSRNQDNARALLDSHHSTNYFTIPYKIDKIKFNVSIDSAIVYTSSVYDGYGKLYIKKNESWILNKEIYHIVE